MLGLVALYLITNYRKNSDPANLKCVEALCQLPLDFGPRPPESEILDCFRRYARTKRQSGHVMSMIPTVMKQQGIRRETYMRYAKYVSGVIKRHS